MVQNDDKTNSLNSLKYSENTTIDLSSYMADGHVVLKIKDHGRGISKKIYLESSTEDLHLR